MILIKIFNVLCIGLILSTSIVDGKGKISSGKKTSSKSSSSGSSWGSSSSSSSSSSHRRTTSRPITHTTSRPIVKQTSRPIESSRYPTQPPYNPHYKPQPHYPQPQPHYPQPQPQPHYPQPHYPQPQPNYPQQHYPSSNYPHQNNYYPHQTQHSYPSWGNEPKKSNVGRNIATHAIAGLGGAYVGHQIGKHNSWYEKKQYERQRERELERQRELEYERTGKGSSSSSSSSSSGGGSILKSRTNTNGLDKLKPITPFKVTNIQNDMSEAKHATGNGIKMLNDVHTRYNNDPQKNEISKAAEANMFLNMKLRPSKSETIPKKNYTTEELQSLMLSGGGLALIGGALGAIGAAGAGPGPGGMGPMGGANPFGGPPNIPGAVPPGIMSVTPDVNATHPNSQVPATNFTITGGQSILQTNQTQTPYKIPLTDPQVLPLVLKQVESDETLEKKRKRKTSGSNSMYTVSNVLICISMVVIKKFY